MQKTRKKHLIKITALILISLSWTFNVSHTSAEEKSTKEYQPSALMVVESKDLYSIIASKKLYQIKTKTKIFAGFETHRPYNTRNPGSTAKSQGPMRK